MGVFAHSSTCNNMSEHEGKQHVSIAICGHVDSGKSTTTGRLIFDLGGVSEREMQKLREEAERLGKSSFAFAFFMDTQKEERERGVIIACQTKEFYTPKYHYTIIDAPGHKDFIKNIGINMKNLNKDNMPKKGDIMVFKNDDSVIPAKRITAMVQTLTLPGPLSVGYSPTCYIRTAHAAMRIAEINKVRSKETAGQWSTEHKQLTSNCAAEVVLVPQQPISCDTFDKYPNLARIAMLEGFNCCAIGKITKIE